VILYLNRESLLPLPSNRHCREWMIFKPADQIEMVGNSFRREAVVENDSLFRGISPPSFSFSFSFSFSCSCSCSCSCSMSMKELVSLKKNGSPRYWTTSGRLQNRLKPGSNCFKSLSENQLCCTSESTNMQSN